MLFGLSRLNLSSLFFRTMESELVCRRRLMSEISIALRVEVFSSWAFGTLSDKVSSLDNFSVVVDSFAVADASPWRIRSNEDMAHSYF